MINFYRSPLQAPCARFIIVFMTILPYLRVYLLSHSPIHVIYWPIYLSQWMTWAIPRTRIWVLRFIYNVLTINTSKRCGRDLVELFDFYIFYLNLHSIKLEQVHISYKTKNMLRKNGARNILLVYYVLVIRLVQQKISLGFSVDFIVVFFFT